MSGAHQVKQETGSGESKKGRGTTKSKTSIKPDGSCKHCVYGVCYLSINPVWHTRPVQPCVPNAKYCRKENK